MQNLSSVDADHNYEYTTNMKHMNSLTDDMPGHKTVSETHLRGAQIMLGRRPHTA